MNGNQEHWKAYVFEQQAVQLFSAISHSHPVAWIHHPYQRVGLFEIVAPVWTKGALTTHIPYQKPVESDTKERKNKNPLTNIQSISARVKMSLPFHDLNTTFRAYLPCMNVLILNPKVGLMPDMSSLFNFLRIVVFPALSRPLYTHYELLAAHVHSAWAPHRKSIRISFSFWRFFLMIVRSPISPWTNQGSFMKNFVAFNDEGEFGMLGFY